MHSVNGFSASLTEIIGLCFAIPPAIVATKEIFTFLVPRNPRNPRGEFPLLVKCAKYSNNQSADLDLEKIPLRVLETPDVEDPQELVSGLLLSFSRVVNRCKRNV
jgi:hypothetical protein